MSLTRSTTTTPTGTARGLLDWLEAPAADRSIGFADEDGGFAHHSYADLARSAHQVASLLRSEGIERNQPVALVLSTGPEFVASFFGALLAGGTPTPIVPPNVFDEHDRYVAHSARLLAVAKPLTLATPDLMPIVTDATRAAGTGEPVALTLDESEPEYRRDRPADHALLQFTSGSTGTPRGVQVTYDNLESNIRMIRDWIDWRPDEAGAHWLPLFHDMGLIGCLLTPAVHCRDLFILRPDQFVRAPGRWVECFGRAGAAFTAGPNFAFAYAAKRVDPATLEGMDFSGWRGAIIGAERLDAGALGSFARLLEPHGFRAETFLPAYGLAEATLAVTGRRFDQQPRAALVDWSSLSFGAPVDVVRTARVDDPELGDGAGWLVGCGHALPGVEVSVVGDDGAELPEGHLGELLIRGVTVADGYLAGDETSVTEFGPAGLRSGDAGFVHDGHLYVTGRIGDSVKVRGRSVFVEDLEARLVALDGVRKGRCVVLPGVADGQEALTVLVEGRAGPWAERAAEILADQVAAAPSDIRVIVGGPGTIERTSSGKPRRRVLWRRLVEGELEGAVETVHGPGGRS